MDIGRRQGERVARTVGQIVDEPEEVGCMASVMIPQGHEDIARVSPHYNVLDLRTVRQPVQRQVGLDETPVALVLQL